MIRPTSLPASLDGLRLRAELAAATRKGWDQPAERQAALAKLKAYLTRGRAHAESRLQGASGGLEAARTLSGVMNAVLRALYDSIASDLTDQGARTPGLALCAVGGYGAGELAPHSDIDLLFLVDDPAPEHATLIVERTLYALWDSGLPVGGGAIRTVKEAIALARDDVSERTALLDIRSLTGDVRLVRELLSAFEEELLGERAGAFAAAKLTERDERVDRQGDSRYGRRAPYQGRQGRPARSADRALAGSGAFTAPTPWSAGWPRACYPSPMWSAISTPPISSGPCASTCTPWWDARTTG